ncbi:hypothetical protein Q31b_25470 [Novipirellula aureliae]|uniref:Uncharacterized protein n=1 Tax=Novipirellula aureliae TaxID=2527966 RepID=A0A5C6E7R3_9BACT|nr:hypothetical protein [Novipirellula aureliae]TWU43506.1 hypothetical protein Q31b_25470 [Novipirellula aureliae]
MPATLENPKTRRATEQRQNPGHRVEVRPHPIKRDSTPRKPIGRQAVVRTSVPVATATAPTDGRPTRRKRRSQVSRFFRPFTLEKSFTLMGFVTGAVLVVLFATDLIFAWPLMRASTLFDVTFMLVGLLMLVSSFGVAKDQVRGRRPPKRIGSKLL